MLASRDLKRARRQIRLMQAADCAIAGRLGYHHFWSEEKPQGSVGPIATVGVLLPKPTLREMMLFMVTVENPKTWAREMTERHHEGSIRSSQSSSVHLNIVDRSSDEYEAISDELLRTSESKREAESWGIAFAPSHGSSALQELQAHSADDQDRNSEKSSDWQRGGFQGKDERRRDEGMELRLDRALS